MYFCYHSNSIFNKPEQHIKNHKINNVCFNFFKSIQLYGCCVAGFVGNFWGENFPFLVVGWRTSTVYFILFWWFLIDFLRSIFSLFAHVALFTLWFFSSPPKKGGIQKLRNLKGSRILNQYKVSFDHTLQICDKMSQKNSKFCVFFKKKLTEIFHISLSDIPPLKSRVVKIQKGNLL